MVFLTTDFPQIVLSCLCLVSSCLAFVFAFVFVLSCVALRYTAFLSCVVLLCFVLCCVCCGVLFFVLCFLVFVLCRVSLYCVIGALWFAFDFCCVMWPGTVWRGIIWTITCILTRRENATRYIATQDNIKTTQQNNKNHNTTQDKTRQDRTRQDPTRQDNTSQFRENS